MSKVLSYTASILLVFLSLNYFVQQAIGSGLVEDEYVFLLYVVGALVAIGSLLFAQRTKPNAAHYVSIGDVRYEEQVLIQLVNTILMQKNQLKDYNIAFANDNENCFHFQVRAIPSLTEVYSFEEFATEMTEEVKELIHEYTGHDKVTVQFHFTGEAVEGN